jgi:hypothetical protein
VLDGVAGYGEQAIGFVIAPFFGRSGTFSFVDLTGVFG